MTERVDLNLWYAALGSQLGVVIACNSPGDTEKVRQKLYSLRKEANDPDLDSISVVQSPTNPIQLWLVKRKT